MCKLLHNTDYICDQSKHTFVSYEIHRWTATSLIPRPPPFLIFIIHGVEDLQKLVFWHSSTSVHYYEHKQKLNGETLGTRLDRYLLLISCRSEKNHEYNFTMVVEKLDPSIVVHLLLTEVYIITKQGADINCHTSVCE